MPTPRDDLLNDQSVDDLTFDEAMAKLKSIAGDLLQKPRRLSDVPKDSGHGYVRKTYKENATKLQIVRKTCEEDATTLQVSVPDIRLAVENTLDEILEPDEILEADELTNMFSAPDDCDLWAGDNAAKYITECRTDLISQMGVPCRIVRYNLRPWALVETCPNLKPKRWEYAGSSWRCSPRI
jgi:hypothetical protein